MSNGARVPITNVYMDGDYTGRIWVGSQKTAMNVILDTGSSALALDGHKYQPNLTAGDRTTDLAQTDSYGDGSNWTGAVIQTTVGVGAGASQVVLSGVSAAVVYQQSANMFRGADGILGLAYAPLDTAYQMAGATWPAQYSATRVLQGTPTTVTPYFTQLSQQGSAADKFAFYTKRSFVHAGGGGVDDPLNQGWLIIGGGEECSDLYTGPFETAKVVADDWYNTNLKAIQVGSASPIYLRARGPLGMPSNSIVDSGTNSLNLGPTLLKAVISSFAPAQQSLLRQAIFDGDLVTASSLELDAWPDLVFVLEGDSGDISLRVSPHDYWQVDAPKVGAAMAAITTGQEGLAILGLPLMNGYFTIFDGSADEGRGAIRFAASRRS